MNEFGSAFIEYASSYISLNDRVRLKINHTFRVVELCEKIAISLNMSEEDIFIAKLCGLLHDIGRFEQWKRFETFKDSESIDHGDLGVEVLKENNFIRVFNKDEQLDNLLLNTVKYHNKYQINPDLDDREKLFCNIVRDADKIDILYLYSIEDIELNIGTDSFSDEIYNSLLAKKQIKKIDCKNKTDLLSVSLGFVFDFNFKHSFEILKYKNYINEIIDIYKHKSLNSSLDIQLEEIRKIINRYIDGRC